MKTNINKLNLSELQELKDLINLYLSDSFYLKLINGFQDKAIDQKGFLIKIKKANYKPTIKGQNNYIRDEYICKVVYLPPVFIDYIHLSKIRTFFNFAGNLFTSVIRCDYNTNDLIVHEIYKEQYYITTGISNLHNLFSVIDKDKLNNTLFIFTGLTYDLIMLLLAQIRIHINGGSHNKRYLIQPLELEVIRIMECLYDFVTYEIGEDSLDLKHRYSEFFKFNSIKLAKLSYILRDSYYLFNELKTRNDKDFKIKLNKFYRFWKLAYNIENNKINLEGIFLNLFYISEVNSEGVLLRLKDFAKEKFNNRLTLVNTRINELNNKSSNNITSISLPSGKREYHTTSLKIYTNDNTNTTVSNIGFKNNTLNTYLSIVETIINNNETPLEKQIKLENNWLELISEQLQDLDYLKKQYSNQFIKKLIKAKETLDLLEINGRIRSKFPRIYPFINNYETLLLTYGVALNGVNMKMGYNNICSLIGKKVILQIFLSYLKNSKKFQSIIASNIEIELFNYFSSGNKDINIFFKLINFDYIDYIKLGNFLLDILCRFPLDIFEKTFDETINHQKDEIARLKFNDNNFEMVRTNFIIDPASLPMLCEPVKWSESEYGGYILNKDLKKDIITGSTYHDHKTENRTNLYRAINKMSSIKFSFNTNLLNYLEKEGSYLFDSLKLLTKSEILQRYTQLMVAKTYSKVPFYIPLQVDWRGRIYSQSFFANYQGSDLSLSLIEFWDGEPLTDRGLDSLYIYTCNLYNENNMSKTSYESRIKWTKDNIKNIINMDKDFMLKAENIFTFAAICLVIKELQNNPNYIVKIPVFLDATCSGIQHLAALIKDCYLAKEVNLLPKDGETKPADIYEALRIPINEEIRRIGREDPIYPNLEYVNLSRSDIKQPIMTKTYNVTLYGVKEQLINNFSTVLSENKKDTKYKFPSINKDEIVILNNIDAMKIASIIYNSIFTEYPGLNFIYNYFIEIAKVLNKLNLPIIWSTPSGLEITQQYRKSKINKVAITLGGKTNKLVLREMINKIDTKKQGSAIIPNVIHSLDASHIVNIINNSFYSCHYDKPIITIHDCFGTHPNYMDYLTEIVKLEFIKLYTSDSFLEKFHSRNLQSIQDYGYKVEKDSTLDQNYITYKVRSKLYIPNIPKLGTLDLWKIKDSKYFIT